MSFFIHCRRGGCHLLHTDILEFTLVALINLQNETNYNYTAFAIQNYNFGLIFKNTHLQRGIDVTYVVFKMSQKC